MMMLNTESFGIVVVGFNTWIGLPAVTVMFVVIAARKADFRVRLSEYPVPGDKRDKRIGLRDVAGPARPP